MTEAWTNRGFWLAVGVSAGLLIGNVVQTQKVEATATSNAAEGLTLATGSSNSPNFELLWVLDETGILTALAFGQNRGFQGASSIDLKEAGLRGKGGKKGRYAMVTGRLQASGQNTDACYIAESSQKTVLMVMPDVVTGQLQVVYKGAVR